MVNIERKKEGIKVKGHSGTWYLIRSITLYGLRFHLLEHEIYGDDAAHVIVSNNGNLICEECHDGFYDLYDKDMMLVNKLARE